MISRHEAEIFYARLIAVLMKFELQAMERAPA